MNNTYIILVLILTNIFMAGYIYYNEYKEKSVSDSIVQSDVVPDEGTGTGSEGDDVISNLTPTLEEVKTDDTIKFADFYSYITENEQINVFEVMYNSFVDVQELDDFSSFANDFSDVRMLNGIVKLQDKNLWDKYWGYQYSLLEESNELDVSGEVFFETLDKMYDSITQGRDIIPTRDNIDIDLNVFFSTIDLDDALEWCDVLSEAEDYSYDISSCRDEIYSYRATSTNKYCEKISDDYKRTMCDDFLEFSPGL